MWEYNTTPEFIKSSEELGLSQLVLDSLENWAITIYRVQTPKTKCCFRSPNNKFEIWIARIPDPDSNKGCSGGFRLVYFFILEKNSIYLDRIERRNDLGGKRERPRDQQKFNSYFMELKKYLMDKIESLGNH